MARAATKHEAASIAIGLLGIGVTLWLAMRYGPRALQALKGANGQGLVLGGGLPGSARSTMPQQLVSTSAPGGGMASGVSADLNKLFDSLFHRSSKPESVAQALQRGDTTSANQGVLASIFNLQQYGNPYGDPIATTLAAFGLTSSPEDQLLQSINAASVGGTQPVSSFDFGSFGYAPSDFYGSVSDWWDSMTGPSVQSPDAVYIDQQNPTLFDFGSWGQTPDQISTDAGTYQGDTSGVSSYSGSYANSQLDPTFDPGAGYDAATYYAWNGYSGPVNAPDPWGAGANSPYGISDQIFS